LHGYTTHSGRMVRQCPTARLLEVPGGGSLLFAAARARFSDPPGGVNTSVPHGCDGWGARPTALLPAVADVGAPRTPTRLGRRHSASPPHKMHIIRPQADEPPPTAQKSRSDHAETLPSVATERVRCFHQNRSFVSHKFHMKGSVPIFQRTVCSPVRRCTGRSCWATPKHQSLENEQVEAQPFFNPPTRARHDCSPIEAAPGTAIAFDAAAPPAARARPLCDSMRRHHPRSFSQP